METINFFGYLPQIDIKSIRGINGKILIIRLMCGNKIQNEDKQNKETQNRKQKR